MKPIDFLRRQTLVQEKLSTQDIDLLMIPPSINFFYLFEGYMQLSERLICGVIDKKDDSLLIAPSFEKENMQIQTTFDDVITWKEDEDPYTILKQEISYEPRRIALEPSTPFEVFSRIKKQFPTSEFVNGNSILNELRMIKNDAEMERMVQAAEHTAEGILKTLELIHEGQTELEILKLAQKQMTLLSGEMSWALVQIDDNSAVPHGKPSNKKLKKDSVILIDAGTSCEHYFADITVTSVHGTASDEFKKVYSIVEEANNAALEKSKAGVPAEEVDFAARVIIENAGYGQYFTHRLGHGLGLQVHEEPYIVKGNKEPLVAGNVHTDEPGIYLPDKFGVRIEDDVLVKEKSKRLVEFDRYLWK
ncbi:MAG: aminopeptidase P family protein [Candidatus Heimdallarchaeota archaeon]|nr:aminopeptidase P family protein [Candidatus Heimdallarchaeota archaeon]